MLPVERLMLNWIVAFNFGEETIKGVQMSWTSRKWVDHIRKYQWFLELKVCRSISQAKQNIQIRKILKNAESARNIAARNKKLT